MTWTSPHHPERDGAVLPSLCWILPRRGLIVPPRHEFSRGVDRGADRL